MGSNEVHPQSISFHPSCWVLTWFGFRLINRFGKMEFIIGLAEDKGQIGKSTLDGIHLQSIPHHRLMKKPSTESRPKDAVV